MLTVPFFWQFLLVYAVNVEPLTFTVCILAHHHLPIGGTATVAVAWLIGVIFPLAAFKTFTSGLLPALLLGGIIIRSIKATLVQLLLQFFSGLMDQSVEPLPFPLIWSLSSLRGQ